MLNMNSIWSKYSTFKVTVIYIFAIVVKMDMCWVTDTLAELMCLKPYSRYDFHVYCNVGTFLIKGYSSWTKILNDLI